MTGIVYTCVQCKRLLPVEDFEILSQVEVSSAFALLIKAETYMVTTRSYTCKECGTTTTEEWHKKWKQSC